MLRINQCKIGLRHTKEELFQKVCKQLKLMPDEVLSILPVKRSLDARKKDQIHYSYTCDITLKNKDAEERLLKRYPEILVRSEKNGYAKKPSGEIPLKHRPVIIGAGPAGLFCCYRLALDGYEPILLEQGGPVEERTGVVQNFFQTGELNPLTNVQFGEGGAGTFSDGKLNTMVKETTGKIPYILKTFAEFGAPSEITYVNKPHIGTDVLREVIVSMRKKIVELGATVRFHEKVSDLLIENGKIAGVFVGTELIPCEAVVLAIGHSARDTFRMLHSHGITMERKAFAVGVRIEHKQELINRAQYGECADRLPPADYKLTYTSMKGRAVYSFCMCPGGYVVNASSEIGMLTVNGMSNHSREGENANSAIVVNVTPDDFTSETGSKDVLSGVEFQRKLERAAFLSGNGKIPVQLYGDLKNHKPSVTIGSIIPNTKGAYHLTSLEQCLPPFITEALLEGINTFDHKIKGFADENAVLLGVEARTSSPVRILRNEEFCSSVEGLYPCGEGAGYAGGITSAAMDGLRVYEKIIEKYSPFHRKDQND